MVEQQLGVAFFAELAPEPEGRFTALCAVVVDARRSSSLGEEVRGIVSYSTAFAAREASGYEPTMSLLALVGKECRGCIIARETWPRPADKFRGAAYRAMVEVLAADGVEVAVVARRSDDHLDALHAAELRTAGVGSVRFVRSDSREQPLLHVPAAAGWAYGKGPDFLARCIGGDVRYLDVD